MITLTLGILGYLETLRPLRENSVRERAIVIGAGLAGTLLVNDLAEAFDVVLLEKGPERHHYTPEVRFERRPLASVPTFCLGKGGTTNLWHNGLVPMRRSDLSPGAFQDVVDDSKRYMDRAAQLLYFPRPSFGAVHTRLLEDWRRRLEGFDLSTDPADCLIYPKRHRPLEPHPDIRAIYDVRDLSFAFHHEHVTAVEYRVGDTSSRRRTEADVVIIAAGALGTPGVLQGLLPTLDKDPDPIGLGLIDHPMGFVGKVRIKAKHAELAAALASEDHGDFTSQTPLRLTSKCGRYTGCAYLRPSVTMGNRLSIHKFKSLLGATKGTTRLRNALDPRILHPDILAEAASHLFGVEIPGRVYSILFVGEQKRRENRAWTEDGQLVVDWSISPREFEIIRAMLTQLQEILSPISDEIVLEEDIGDEWLWSCAHHSGTTPLGHGDDTIVDPDLRVHGTRNVFVCDGSVIQEHSYANTGLTIAQLSLRLSHYLQSHAPSR